MFGSVQVALALAAAAAPAPAEPAAPNPRPDTVPALRQWSGATGRFTLKKTARVVATKPFQKVLAPDARLLAKDLKIKARPTKPPRPGDVVLRIDRELETVGKSGYRLRI